MGTNKGYNEIRKINLHKEIRNEDQKKRQLDFRRKNVNIITILIDFPFFWDYNVDIKKDLFYSWEKVMAMYFW